MDYSYSLSYLFLLIVIFSGYCLGKLITKYKIKLEYIIVLSLIYLGLMYIQYSTFGNDSFFKAYMYLGYDIEISHWAAPDIEIFEFLKAMVIPILTTITIRNIILNYIFEYIDNKYVVLGIMIATSIAYFYVIQFRYNVFELFVSMYVGMYIQRYKYNCQFNKENKKIFK